MTLDYRKDYLATKTEQKDLKEIKDTKHEQEIAVVTRIINLLNKGLYNDIEDFYGKNNNLQDFIKRHLEVPITHFGHNETPLNEEDYKNIIENIRSISNKKQSIDTNNVSTTIIDQSEYNSMKIDKENSIIDNSDSNQRIDERMRQVQSQSEEFQTIDANKNTENIFKELKSRQEEINPIPLNEINPYILNDEQKELFKAVLDFQLGSETEIKVDLDKAIIIDENGKILKIEKDDGKIKIISGDGSIEKEQNTEHKTFQKQLVPNPNTIYSN